MNKILEHSLVNCNPERFKTIKEEALSFCNEFVGHTVMRDDIFSLISLFAKKRNFPFKLLRFPIDDTELCAFTCVKKGTVFVTINTAIPLGKQVFAAAHELYHIIRFIKTNDLEFIENGSLLTSSQMENGDLLEEDKEANAFAALILAPKTSIKEQAQIYNVSFSNLTFKEIILFMDLFALPYKAMVMRCFECGFIDKGKTEELLNSETNDSIIHFCESNGLETRWLKTTPCINNIESIRAMIEKNKQDEVISEIRADEDLIYIEAIVSNLPRS